MSKLTSQALREWYQQFAKELYEKAQIDVTCKEDLGRVKNFYITKWDDNEPMGPEGEFQYAYIPHNGFTYDNPPPGIENPDEYMRWVRTIWNLR